MASKKNGTVIDDLGEEHAEVLASAIVEVADAAKRLLNSKLTEVAILVLLKHTTGISQRDIKMVLKAAADLKRFVKKPQTKE